MPKLFHGLASVQIVSHTPSLQTISNTFHVSDTSKGAAPSFAELTQLGLDVGTYFATTYKAMFGSDHTLDKIVTRNIADPTDPDVPQEATNTLSVAGTRTTSGTSVPENLCGLMFMQTPNASRRFRGHLFLPPLQTAGAINGGLLQTSDSYYTAATAFRDKLRTGYVTSRTWTGTELSKYDLVLYSRKAAQLGLPSVANVSFVGIRADVHYLRSRTRGTT